MWINQAVVALSLFLTAFGPVAVTPPDMRAVEPQIAIAGKRAFVTYGVGDVLFLSRSDDGARTFSAPIRIGSAGRLSLGMRRGPRIAASGNRVVVSAVYGRRGGGQDGDLLAWRSVDGGRSWLGPVTVNDAPGSAREGLHGMGVSGAGRLACVWLDLRAKGTEVWSSTSEDGGASWQKNVRVYQSPAGTVCECCHPSVAFGKGNDLHVMFRNWLGGARDMYLATSANGGKSFGPAAKLGAGTWMLNACPMDGGALAVAPDGTVQTVWRREYQVYSCAPGSPERNLGEGGQPWIAMAASPAIVWQRGGAIHSTGVAGPLGSGTNPAVASAERVTAAVWADERGRVWCAQLN